MRLCVAIQIYCPKSIYMEMWRALRMFWRHEYLHTSVRISGKCLDTSMDILRHTNQSCKIQTQKKCAGTRIEPDCTWSGVQSVTTGPLPLQLVSGQVCLFNLPISVESRWSNDASTPWNENRLQQWKETFQMNQDGKTTRKNVQGNYACLSRCLYSGWQIQNVLSKIAQFNFAQRRFQVFYQPQTK